MDNWIIRIVAALCAVGSTALLWTLGVFAAVPWHEGRMLALDRIELQIIGIPLVVGIAAAWGALHILGIADRADSPRTYATIRATLIVTSIAAVIGGAAWTLSRIA